MISHDEYGLLTRLIMGEEAEEEGEENTATYGDHTFAARHGHAKAKTAPWATDQRQRQFRTFVQSTLAELGLWER